MRAGTAARKADGFGALGRRAHEEYGLADDARVRGGAGGAAEVHTQIAMSIIVPTLGEAVRRIGAQRYDQREGRDERDQTIAAQTRAQEDGATSRLTNKRSLWAAAGQQAYANLRGRGATSVIRIVTGAGL